MDMARFLDPPAPKPLIAEEKIDKTYRSMRLKVFLGAFMGYAGYYLVRKNLSLAAGSMIENGILADKAQAGLAMAGIPVAYAFSKFLMGGVSDRSDARKFLVLGLLLASFTMVLTGLIPFGTHTALNVAVLFVLMLLAGWFSGMGWPPCGRIMAHWFSQNERSFKMSVWNTAHNLGGGSLSLLATAGMAILLLLGVPRGQAWRGVFLFPAFVAVLIALFAWWALRDTPASCGLPSVADWRNDHSGIKTGVRDDEKIPFRRIFVDYILKNKLFWVVGLGNAFVYMVRYGIGDWSPTYLQQTGLMDLRESHIAFSIYEYAAIPGTIVCGWISSRFFKGRCTPPNVIFMGLTLLGILLYWQAEPLSVALAGPGAAALTKGLVYTALFLIGFCIYGPVAMIGIQAINLVPKNAAGTAGGFMGMFGYLLGDALLSKVLMGQVAEASGWNTVFLLILLVALASVVLLSSTWKQEKALLAG